ncbi:putative conserved secreted protein [Synechococcus sp. MEDNS5]|uniref:hypothetical protein n=1 Tax=Synechococcus sp. MEDNS5 TaxID=1442554 RepID=UPI001647E427|nr:hypothetical protein [Synechococcus sp. MEDNS5]QNJ06750.1 putative conserved secreted protein [Synechococcus sp. MEDNS5]
MDRLLVLPVVMTGFVFGLPMATLPMGELQALNRELGQLCRKPPQEALAVCRIHARLIRAL